MARNTQDISERTELPTPLRLQEARRQGFVPRSSDLVSSAVLLGGAVMLAAAAPTLINSLKAMMTRLLGETSTTSQMNWSLVTNSAGDVIAVITIILIGMVVIAVLANVMQFGFLFSSQSLQLDFSRLRPAGGSVVGVRGAVRAAMSAAKIAAVLAIVVMNVLKNLPEIMASSSGGAATIVSSIGSLLQKLALELAAVLVGLAIIDWLYQRWQYRQDLKITRRQLREDLRQMEGDEATRSARLRQRNEQVTMQQLSRQVPLARVIVAAPLGLAVAVGLDSKSLEPQITAEATGTLAVAMRRLAIEHGLTVVEDRNLAAMLYKYGRSKQAMPDRLAERLAEVMAYSEVVSGEPVGV